tara:strand:+ start:462 stop:617 length:156 start_codon:yes stop_codon:yes gene_type:complete
MNSKNMQNKVLQNKVLKPLNRLEFCKVSKASTEIMLARFCKGKEIEFPFSQ